MAYADADFAITLYGEDYVLTALDRDQDRVVDTALAEAMFDVCSAEMDSFFMGRVPLPLDVSKIPLDLKMRCVDLVMYRASSDAASMSTIKETRFKAAQEWLQMVAANKIKLTYGSESVAGPHLVEQARVVTAATAHYEQTCEARRFSRKNLKGIL
jgi:phage gp36-like protein